MATEAYQYIDAMRESRGRGCPLSLTTQDGQRAEAWYRGSDRLVTPPDNRPEFYATSLADALDRLANMGYNND